MNLFDVLTFIVSILALAISLFSHHNSKKQTQIMQAELEEMKKPNIIDESYNPYTNKLESISKNIDNVAKAIHNLSDKI